MTKPFSFKCSIAVCCLFLFCLLTFRVESSERKKFVVCSPPKCGTHLIGKILQSMLNEEASYHLTDFVSTEQALELIEAANYQNQFTVAHNYSEELLDRLVERDYRIIFIIRDPRDQLISMTFFMRKGNWSQYRVAHIADFNEQITEMISGMNFGFSCYERCMEGYLDRVQRISPRSLLIVRFENLVGVKGGGTQKRQIKEILKLARFIKFDLTQEEALTIGENAFGGTWTFREGQVGEWKKYFQPIHSYVYKVKYGDKLISLGYEKNKEW